MDHPCRRVLVVEDDADLRDAIGDFLSAEGVEAIQATTGREALELLRREPLPDVILLDLGIPEISGPDLLGRIRQEPRWSAIPIAVMSGFEPQRFAYEPAPDEFIAKPFDLERLNGALSHLCRKGKAAAVP